MEEEKVSTTPATKKKGYSKTKKKAQAGGDPKNKT